MILSFLISIPFMIAKEGAKWSQFVTTFNTNPIVSFNLIASGLWFYGIYTERERERESESTHARAVHAFLWPRAVAVG